MEQEYQKILQQLQETQEGVISIDGRCGSGKTTLGQFLAEKIDCNLIHMDDFYLPLSQRQQDWREHPGKNMDFSRLIAEVFEPALAGKPIKYRPFLCKRQDFGAERYLPPKKLTIIEGSYSQMPILRGYYTKMYFVTCSSEEQEKRLRRREGEGFGAFQALWIPLEEKYLTLYPPVGEYLVL